MDTPDKEPIWPPQKISPGPISFLRSNVMRRREESLSAPQEQILQQAKSSTRRLRASGANCSYVPLRSDDINLK